MTPLSREGREGLAQALEHIMVGAIIDDPNVALAAAAAELRKMDWQPIETAPKDEDVFFWIVPKTADETYRDTSGSPIVSEHAPYLHRGLFGSWGALSKASHWMPLPDPPTAAGETT